jgi:IQ calmodulin-binding motif
VPVRWTYPTQKVEKFISICMMILSKTLAKYPVSLKASAVASPFCAFSKRIMQKSAVKGPEQAKSPSPIQFSTMDFFDRFVRPASEKGLLRTPLPTPITKQHVKHCSIQLLQAAKLQPENVRIFDDNYGGTIILSKQGLAQVMGYLQYRQESKAAIMIQAVYRGYATRKHGIRTLRQSPSDIPSSQRQSSPAIPSSQLSQSPPAMPAVDSDSLDVYISQISALYHTILTAHRSTSVNYH